MNSVIGTSGCLYIHPTILFFKFGSATSRKVDSICFSLYNFSSFCFLYFNLLSLYIKVFRLQYVSIHRYNLSDQYLIGLSCLLLVYIRISQLLWVYFDNFLVNTSDHQSDKEVKKYSCVGISCNLVI